MQALTTIYASRDRMHSTRMHISLMANNHVKFNNCGSAQRGKLECCAHVTCAREWAAGQPCSSTTALPQPHPPCLSLSSAGDSPPVTYFHDKPCKRRCAQYSNANDNTRDSQSCASLEMLLQKTNEQIRQAYVNA